MSNEHITDDQIITEAARYLGEMHVENCGLGDIKSFARAILALRPATQPTQTWDANQIAMACAQAEISDGHCQSLLIALEESNKG